MKFTGGLPETACGLGSTLRLTAEIRAKLPRLLSACGIEHLLDAPCGDGNWISQTDLTGIAYHGIDASADNLQAFVGKVPAKGYAPARQTFERGDILKMDLPHADAIMCREFFQHIADFEVCKFLEKISGEYTWLLATSFNCDTNMDIGPDRFRPVNLQAAPYELGWPEQAIEDPPGSGRILGAWRL